MTFPWAVGYTNAVKDLIFDFDGTIADTTALMLDIGNEMLTEIGRPAIGVDEFKRLRDMTIPQGLRELKLPAHLLPSLALRAKQMLQSRLPQLQPCDGMIDVLKQLHGQNRTLGITSSNSAANIDHFLERYGIQGLFAFVQSGASLFGKGWRLKLALRRYHLDKENVLYVGDEVRDIDTARSAGVEAAAVTWGVNSRDLLTSHQPDHLIEKPAQLLKR